MHTNNYGSYSIKDLCDARHHVDEVKCPDQVTQLEREIERRHRHPASSSVLDWCQARDVLDGGRFPQLMKTMEQEIGRRLEGSADRILMAVPQSAGSDEYDLLAGQAHVGVCSAAGIHALDKRQHVVNVKGFFRKRLELLDDHGVVMFASRVGFEWPFGRGSIEIRHSESTHYLQRREIELAIARGRRRLANPGEVSIVASNKKCAGVLGTCADGAIVETFWETSVLFRGFVIWLWLMGAASSIGGPRSPREHPRF